MTEPLCSSMTVVAPSPTVRGGCRYVTWRSSCWRPERDSDPRPTTYEAAALTAELPGRSIIRGKCLFLRNTVKLGVSDDAIVDEFLNLSVAKSKYHFEDLLVMLSDYWCSALPFSWCEAKLDGVVDGSYLPRFQMVEVYEHSPCCKRRISGYREWLWRKDN